MARFSAHSNKTHLGDFEAEDADAAQIRADHWFGHRAKGKITVKSLDAEIRVAAKATRRRKPTRKKTRGFARVTLIALLILIPLVACYAAGFGCAPLPPHSATAAQPNPFGAFFQGVGNVGAAVIPANPFLGLILAGAGWLGTTVFGVKLRKYTRPYDGNDRRSRSRWDGSDRRGLPARARAALPAPGETQSVADARTVAGNTQSRTFV